MDLLPNLLSGLAGALAVQLLAMLWSEIKRKREYNALLNGIIAECDYNLGIVDEICDGVVQGFSFKRMSVEFFRSAREASVKYTDASGLEFTSNQPCAESGISAQIHPAAKPNVPLPILLVLVVMADSILLLSLFILFARGSLLMSLPSESILNWQQFRLKGC